MNLPFYTASDVEAAVSMPGAINAMKEAFGSISSGDAVVPLRINMPIEKFHAHHLSMPAYINGGKYLTVKLINVHPNNPAKGLQLINGVILVMEAETGKSVALVDGPSVTAIRTGAASGLATKYLSATDSKKAVVFGNGVQAKTQIEAIQSVRDLDEIRVIGRDLDKVESFCEQFDSNVFSGTLDDLLEADIICTATSSASPLFEYGELSKGVHINAVGAHGPTKRELPTKLIQNAKVYVDSLSSSKTEAGNLIIPIQEGMFEWKMVEGELGSLIDSNLETKNTASELTVFSSVGTAVQDLVIAVMVMEFNQQ